MKLISIVLTLVILSGCLHHGAPKDYIDRTTNLADQIEEVAHSIEVDWKNYKDGKITAQDSADAFDRYATKADTIGTWVEREKTIAPADYVNITWEEGAAALLLKASAEHFSYGIRNSDDEYKHAGELDLASGRHHLALARALIEQDT